MIPLYDRSPTRHFALATAGLIATCVAAFAWEISIGTHGGVPAYAEMLRDGGVVPARLVHWRPGVSFSGPIAPPLTVLSAMFLHADVMHLAGNMLYLWIFGHVVENELGPAKFVVFYLLAGAAAAAVQVAVAAGSGLPMIGASGAIAGILGAYFVRWPKARIRTLLFLGFFARLADVPAWFLLGVWFLLQILSSVFAGDGPGVAWWAHIGGFAFGAAVMLVYGLFD